MKYVAGVVFVTMVLLASCVPGGGSDEAAAGQEPRALAVEALTVSRGILNEYVEASGTISGINEAYVVSEAQGIIRSVNFDLGDRIEAGQALLQVDDKIQQINLEQAKIEYDNDRLDFNAAQNLYDAGRASQSELNRANSALSGAKARYETALKAYNDCTLQAPISGFIAEKDPAVTLGNYLNAGTRVARLVDISALKLEISVGESEVGLLSDGAAVEIFIPTCSRVQNTGKIDAIAAGSDPATGSFPVVITWENNCYDIVRAGMTASVKIRTNETTPKVIVPASAVFTQAGKTFIFTAENGKAVPREVTPGRVLGNRLEIESGLEGGETIIISGISALREGREVNPSIIGESGSRQ
jgi:membrane fusion protein, multidrug efflux system